jgi:hypothetical protein
VHIFFFFFFFLFAFFNFPLYFFLLNFGVSRSKDSGGYDLGELDQALFLYLDGQDPSTVQDQRRELSLSLSLSLSFPFKLFVPCLLCFLGGRFFWVKAVWVTGKACP